MTKNNTETTVIELPACCFSPCAEQSKKAQYDGKTIFGRWAYMCEECFKKYGTGLGLGKGQKLVENKK